MCAIVMYNGNKDPLVAEWNRFVYPLEQGTVLSTDQTDVCFGHTRSDCRMVSWLVSVFQTGRVCALIGTVLHFKF